jgi:methionyl-tRNA formyltransferase
MRIVFFGTPDFSVPSLQLLAARHDVGLVVSRPDRKAGRKNILKPPPVAIAAQDLDLDLYQPANPNQAVALKTISEYEADVLVVVAFGRLIGSELRSCAPHGAVNVHPSLLPAFRGASPIQAAIASGAKQTGVTLIRLVERLDAGPIISSRQLSVAPDQSAIQASESLAAMAADLLRRTLPEWVAGAICEQPQDEAYASMTRPLDRRDGDLDLRRPAIELYDRWRAFQPWPGVQVQAGDVRCKLLELMPGSRDLSIGSTLICDDALLIGCGEGSIVVRLIQPEGRDRMEARDFERGYRSLLDEVWGQPFPDGRLSLVV